MNVRIKTALAVVAVAMAAHASAQVTFYESDNFLGQSFTTQRQVQNFDRFGFNDRASSAVVAENRWEVCENIKFRGRCVVLRPGQYPSLRAMGLNDGISSMRAVSRNARIDERRYAPMPVATPVVPQVTFFGQPGFQGQSVTLDRPAANFERFGFNDRASSAVVVGGPWELCEDVRFGGRCVVLRPGRYPSLQSMGLNDRVSSGRLVDRDGRAPQPVAAPMVSQVTLYENDNFQARSVTADRVVENLQTFGFNDRASSAVVVGGPWELCENARFGGRCVVLRPGQYPSLASMGLNDRISSVRSVDRDARLDAPQYAPAPVAAPDFRRRDNEGLYEANVTSVRAVVGTPEQRCWVEREQVSQGRGDANVPGAIAGALIGGILGHQVGGGSGKDVATVGGMVAGGALGANVGRDNAQQPTYKDVQRCENVPSQAQPQYWDVTYNFRGQEHRVQMTAPPGPTVTVNEQGEPRK